MNSKTLFGLGFSMPAEWEKHEATWLSWPKNPLTFPRETIGLVESIYVEMVRALSVGERVEILVDDATSEDRVSPMVSGGNVRFHHIRSADVWIRDYGPIFVRHGKEIAATKWRFNAWGEKYDDLMSDNNTGLEVAKETGFKIFESGIVLEGGSIDVNGNGGCLTTKQCLLNRNRNPELRQTKIENFLRDYLGVEKVIWLEEGIAGDDTDGHVDDIARFVNKDTILCMVESDTKGENSIALKRNYELLSKARGVDGRRINLITLEMPRKVEGVDGRLPASYANFYIGNAVVLLPVFGDEKRDSIAISLISDLFPGRRVVPIDCRALVYGFGGIHCVTQQQPGTM